MYRLPCSGPGGRQPLCGEGSFHRSVANVASSILLAERALDCVVPYGQVTWYRLRIFTTIYECFFLGVTALGAIPLIPSTLARDLVSGLLMTALGLGSGLGLASSIWSLRFCYHYLVPKGSETEEVTFKRSDLKRFGWPLE